jgi:hypothetical protein
MTLCSLKIFKTFKTNCCQQHWLNLKSLAPHCCQRQLYIGLKKVVAPFKAGGGKKPNVIDNTRLVCLDKKEMFYKKKQSPWGEC